MPSSVGAAASSASAQLHTSYGLQDAHFVGIKRGRQDQTVQLGSDQPMSRDYEVQLAPASAATSALGRWDALSTFVEYQAEEHARMLCSCIMGRIISGKPRGEKDSTGLQNFIKDPTNRSKLDIFLASVGGHGYDADAFAREADSSYSIYNSTKHASFDNDLQAKVQRFIGTGILERLKDSLPWVYLVLSNFETLKQYLM